MGQVLPAVGIRMSVVGFPHGSYIAKAAPALGLFARTVLKPLYEVLYMFSRMSNGDMLNVTMLFV